MTAPALAAHRFLCSCGLGVLLGLGYDCLRPFRRSHPQLGDLLFLLLTFRLWLEQSFGLCGGDLRLGYSFGLLAGALVWEWTLGMLLRPVFDKIWEVAGAIAHILFLPVKIIAPLTTFVSSSFFCSSLVFCTAIFSFSEILSLI